jgi:predicted phage terminase large subunit-like protein
MTNLKDEGKPRECGKCGSELPSTWGFKKCADCREALRRQKSDENLEKRRRLKLISAEREKQERADRKKRIAARKKKEQASVKKQVKRETESKKLDKLIEARANTEEAAAQIELASRVLSKRHLLPFVLRTIPAYRAGWVHKDICQRLERFSQNVVDEKSPRLMIQMPPRHGKSELASIRFPAWHLGKYPTHEFIATSYGSPLALGFSRKVRALLRSPGYKVVFDTRLDPDQQNAEGWATTEGGMYVPAGIGGPITGKGAHILLIDDPVKNMVDADSETTREMHKDWYQSTAYTRLAPGGGVLVIQTRWHDDDLSGWLEHEMFNAEGDEWEIVRYPAIAEEDEYIEGQCVRLKGEALHPERYDLGALTQIKGVASKRVWSALYQQNPVAAEGEYFKLEDFRYYKGEPPRSKDMTIFDIWDLAIGQKQHNDWTVGVTFGLDKDDKLWVLGMRRGKWATDKIVSNILDNFKEWQPEYTFMEKGHISMAIGPPLKQEVARRIKEDGAKLYHRFTGALEANQLVPGRLDKPSRARAIQARFQAHSIRLPTSDVAPWVDDIVNELLRCWSGIHDDIADVFAWAGIVLEDRVHTPTTDRRRSDAPESWKDKLSQYVKGAQTSGSHMAA